MKTLWPFLLLLSACATPHEHSIGWAETELAAMSPEEKIGQLLVPTVSPGKLNAKPEALASFEKLLAEEQPGCLHVFRSDLKVAEEIIRRAQNSVKRPLLITADFEGGPGYILRGGTRFPRGLGLAASDDEALIAKVAEATAKESRAIGVHVNFFPVLDVNSNPENPIINLRAFGDDAERVARLGTSYLRALQAAGMIATAKHFPGHGDTATDSHLGLPVSDHDLARLKAVELVPFVAAVRAGVGAVMSAHIAWPKVTGEARLPATLAPSVLTDLLRTEMGFEGIVFTDALDMKGITQQWSEEDASLRALNAGADALLFVKDVPKVAKRLKAAYASGELTKARLDEAVLRILRAKEKLGLHEKRHPDAAPSPTMIEEHKQLALRAARASITLVRDRQARLSRRDGRGMGKKVLLVLAKCSSDHFDWESPGEGFANELRARGVQLEVVYLQGCTFSASELATKARNSDDTIVFAASGLSGFPKDTLQSWKESLDALASAGAILISGGNPYALSFASPFETVLLAYDEDPLSEQALAEVFLGERRPSARLPVNLPQIGRRGEGLSP